MQFLSWWQQWLICNSSGQDLFCQKIKKDYLRLIKLKTFFESFIFAFLPFQLFETANKYHFYHSLALLGAAHCGKPAVVST